jgi:hypothetical protein
MLLVVLALAQLVKLQEAQSRAASLPSPHARPAVLAFADDGDWRAVATPGPVSLETMPPFDDRPGKFAPPEDGGASAAESTSIVVTANSPTEDEKFEPVVADDPPLAIAAAIQPAVVDLVSSPPLEAVLAPTATTRAPATSATGAPDVAPAIIVADSESVAVTLTTSKPQAAKVTAMTALPISRSDVKIPNERPRRLAVAQPSHAPVTHGRRAKPPLRAKPSNPKKPVRLVRTTKPTAPAAPAPVRAQPTDPFTALFGGPRTPANARN